MHLRLEYCVWFCHIKEDITELEEGQEKATGIKSMRWLMDCEQLCRPGHSSLEKRRGAEEANEKESHRLHGTEINCSVLFMNRK